MRREKTRLRLLLDDVEIGALGEAQDKGIDLRVVLEQDVELEVDVRLVASALGNLVRNAVKYSCAGGSVEVRGATSAVGVRIEVEDSCGGLPAGKNEEAFAPFVRLNSSEAGFGLGLAIARQAVDAHAGTIRVQKLPGKGCIFVLELLRSGREGLPRRSRRRPAYRPQARPRGAGPAC